jgi:hypothetical protein
MKVRIYFGQREWWLRLCLWKFADGICRDSKTFFRNLRTVMKSTSEIMTGVILTTESHVDFHNSRNARKLPKCTFCADLSFSSYFPYY